MPGLRVLRLYHSAVVDEYRQRERFLRSRHGYDVHVVCPPEWPEGGGLARPSPDPDVPVHIVHARGPQRPNLFWYSVPGLRKVLRALRPAIVDLHEEPFSLAAASLLLAMRLEASTAKLCVYSAQNLPKRYPPPFSTIEKRTLSLAGAAYPCSTEAGDRLVAHRFRGPIHVLPLGVTLSPFMPRTGGPIRVGFVGRLEPYKGGLIAVRAFAAAAADSSAALEIVGAGPEQVAMREVVSEHGLDERVAFMGALPQDQTLERMSTYDIVLVPSLTTRTWKEQFGRVPVQAMAHGAVVIASDSGSLREVVDSCGVLVREGDVARFAETLRDLIHDRARLDELRERAWQRAAQHFTWEAISDGVDAMYEGLFAHASPTRPHAQDQEPTQL
jgi:glycosyltransferase involved in cell wall biosynthesis